MVDVINVWAKYLLIIGEKKKKHQKIFSFISEDVISSKNKVQHFLDKPWTFSWASRCLVRLIFLVKT